MADTITTLLEGVAHQRAGRPERAERLYQAILAREPQQPNALYLYGLLQLGDGRARAAAAMLEQASCHRHDAELLLNLARARLSSNDPAGALESATAALASGAPRAAALHVRGTALNALDRHEEAVDTLSEAAQLDPRNAATRLNLGNAYADLDRLGAAERHVRAAIALSPELVEAHASLGYLLTSQGNLPAASAACEAALMLDPACPEAHWNLATVLLLTGDYRRGFEEYEWHRQHRLFRAYWRELPGLPWDGFPLDGQRLLVHAGQGLGDTIQLARFMPELARRGARVTLACSQPLVALLTGQPGLTAVVDRAAPLPDYDCWVDQMSLPRLLALDVATIPGSDGSLTASASLQGVWASRLDRHAGTETGRIGFAWAGNPGHRNDRRRSLAFDIARQIARPGMVSLQLGPRANEAGAMGLDDKSPDLTDFAQTAALVANLDLVITVDTAVAHVAGALGVPTWLMLPAAPDWRWLLGRDDTPWYRSLQLFRQQQPDDWSPVVARIAAMLDHSSGDAPARGPEPHTVRAEAAAA